MKTTGYAVRKICEAQEHLAKAADLLTSARLDTVRLSDQIDRQDFRGTDLDCRLNNFSGQLTEQFYALDPLIRRLAELISEPPQENTSGGDGE